MAGGQRGRGAATGRGRPIPRQALSLRAGDDVDGDVLRFCPPPRRPAAPLPILLRFLASRILPS
jgi:hypothetical protein